MVIPYSKGKDQQGKITNPARRQLNREIIFSLSPFAPENLVSQDGFGSPVPRLSLLISILRLNLMASLRDSSQVPRQCPFIY